MKMILFSGIFFFLSCKTTQYFKSSGILMGRKVSLGLDTKQAAKFLSDKKLMEAELGVYDQEPLNNIILGQITQKYSLDTANLYLLSRLYTDTSENLQYQKTYNQNLEAIKEKVPGRNNKFISRLKDYRIIFIPGLAYKTDTTTGADFSRQRKLFTDLGIENNLIDIDELGLVRENAAMIRKYLLESKSQKRMILVSASKGGLDVLEALGSMLDDAEARNIHAWINVGGIMHGTYLADEYCNFPKSAVAAAMLITKNKSLELVADLRHENRSQKINGLKIPDNIKVIHLAALPFQMHVTKEIRSRFDTLKIYGPNDGLTTIVDTITPKGIVITEIGLDHYFRDKDIDLKTLALASLLF